MTGFLARLALRGAGLAPQAGLVPLGLRPRARFESLAPDPAQTAGQAIDAERPAQPAMRTVHATPVSASPRPPIAPTPRPDPRAEPSVGRTLPPPATQQAIVHAGDNALPSDERRSGPEIVERTAAEGPPPHAATAPAPAMSTGPARLNQMSPSPKADGPASPMPPNPSAAIPPTAVDIAAADEHAARAVAAETLARFQPHDPIAPGLQARDEVRQNEDDAPRSLSVSIGRIEVEFVQPPAPVAPSARQAPERTRGFTAYGAIRRGLPR